LQKSFIRHGGNRKNLRKTFTWPEVVEKILQKKVARHHGVRKVQKQLKPFMNRAINTLARKGARAEQPLP
jgi:hypothetical protein